MTEAEFLLRLVGALESVGASYMVVGSRGSTVHGLSRSTQDVDIVVDLDRRQLDALLDALGDDYYFNRVAAHDALSQRRMFNVIHTPTGWKADLIVRKERPFSKAEFARRQSRTVFGHGMAVATAEDLILSKLEWDRITTSERQRSDALKIAVANYAQLDLAHLRHWAHELGVSAVLEELLAAAKQSS